MTLLTPARAVAMQKRGVTSTAIAHEFGVARQQVRYWFAAMDYDPWAYHGGTIAHMYDAGVSLATIQDVVGICLSGGGSVARLSVLLEERGIERRSPVQTPTQCRLPQPQGPACRRCEILLDEPHESGLCPDCRYEIATGKLAMAPTEFALMAEALEGVR